MTSSEIKHIKQEEALRAIMNNNGSGLVAMATGTGKTKIGVTYATNKVKEKTQANILVVVPTLNLQENTWKEEFYKWGQKEVWDNNVTKKCYVSINSLKDTEWDLVLFDEGHHITPLNSQFFENNTVHNIMALSATEPEDKEKKRLLLKYGMETVYTITLDEALSIGLISPYEIAVIKVPLSTQRDIKINSRVAGGMNSFMQSERGFYWYLKRLYNSAQENLDRREANILRNKMTKFIYNLNSKTEAAKKVLSLLPQTLKVLIFAGNIQQAVELEEKTFNYKTSSKDLDDFIAGNISRLSSVDSINEGITIPGLDLAIITQIQRSVIKITQRTGRTVRFREDHIGKVIVFIAEGTLDEEWAEEALKDFSKDRVTYYNLSEVLSGSVKIFSDKTL